ncbi:DUF2079 domain-containing protein [Streptomyces noursei]|uniref:DUF2079 domain-containing protein n=1 Tax=Streptomyces noursei TaxID=1971 RepID=UPI0019664473|nr:DUF2079 domain-containing protein [Streptomyces noursei]QRX90280.1 DUF2079 domain-containing protein [Streptomyces noursei]
MPSRGVAATVAVAAFVIYSVLALRRHAQFRTTGYDLGIFGQAVRSYAQGHLPVSEIRVATGGPGLTADGFPLLGDHFHPILALLAPVYRLLPHVEVLLLAQAALVAASAYTLTRAATRHLAHLGRWAAPCLGTAYALSWPLQQLIGFDFHEVAFAVPLLALALTAFLDGRWVRAACWASILLLVKEDMGLTVCAFGLLLLRRHRRAGVVLCILGPTAMALTVFAIIPHFNPQGTYGYLTAEASTGAGGGLAPLLSHAWEAVLRLFTPGTKALTVFMILLPSAFLALRSPLLLTAIPTLGWRLASDNPAYWGTQYHYSAVLAPIVYAALIDALARTGRKPDGTHAVALSDARARTPLTPRVDSRAAAVVPGLALAIAAALTFAFPLSQLFTPRLWQDTPRTAAARAALARIPDGAHVLASNSLAPHLTDRTTVHLTTQGVLERHLDPQRHPADWIVADTSDGWPAGEARAVVNRATAAGYHRVFANQGYVVLRRADPSDAPANPLLSTTRASTDSCRTGSAQQQ